MKIFNNIQNNKQKFTARLDMSKTVQNEFGFTNRLMIDVRKNFKILSNLDLPSLKESVYRIRKNGDEYIAYITSSSSKKPYVDIMGRPVSIFPSLTSGNAFVLANKLCKDFKSITEKLAKPYRATY